MSSIRLPAPQRFAGAIRVPGDKSISHRAVLFAALAHGTTEIRNANEGDDVEASVSALRALGVHVEQKAGALRIRGLGRFVDPPGAINCGNSGTTMRLLAGMLAGSVNAVLDGDASLRHRPMERIAAPLRAMGADVTCAPDGLPPVRLARAAGALHGAQHELTVASAQLVSALLLAGLRARGSTTITTPAQPRNHGELMLHAMGARMSWTSPPKAATSGPDAAYSVTVEPSELHALETIDVPGDLSAAAYFIAGATRLSGSRISVLETGVNPTRTAVLDVMRDMGAHIGIKALRERHGELSADIEVSAAAPLRNLELEAACIPNLIDDIPLLCALAAGADGTFVANGLAELRVKESDRIASTIALLRSFGVAVTEISDGIAVRGGRPLRAPERIDTGGDHRIGLTAAVLAAMARAPIVIDDAECIATSFPGFAAAWQAAFA
jgi:3-phosphoshikimate 1-carboxyvinyltransferase